MSSEMLMRAILFVILIIVILLLISRLSVFAAEENGWVITRTESVCTHCEHVPDGYRWHYSNDTTVIESYADFIQRTNGPRLTCSTGFCTKESNGPVKPSGGCNCGCDAAVCNCSHSPNTKTKSVLKSNSPILETQETWRQRIGIVPNSNSGRWERHCVNGNCRMVWRSY